MGGQRVGDGIEDIEEGADNKGDDSNPCWVEISFPISFFIHRCESRVVLRILIKIFIEQDITEDVGKVEKLSDNLHGRSHLPQGDG